MVILSLPYHLSIASLLIRSLWFLRPIVVFSQLAQSIVLRSCFVNVFVYVVCLSILFYSPYSCVRPVCLSVQASLLFVLSVIMPNPIRIDERNIISEFVHQNRRGCVAWVLKDYTSQTLDLTSPDVYRE